MSELVKVIWNDAEDFTTSAWASDEEVQEFGSKVCFVESVGWLVKKNKSYISLASDYVPELKHWGTVRKIPKKMIKSIEFFQDLHVLQSQKMVAPETVPDKPKHGLE